MGKAENLQASQRDPVMVSIVVQLPLYKTKSPENSRFSRLFVAEKEGFEVVIL